MTLRRPARVVALAVGVLAVGGIAVPPAMAHSAAGAATPVIRSVSPHVARVGQRITITGSGLRGVRGVRFNGARATRFHAVSPRKVTARLPVTASSGRVSVLLRRSTLLSHGALTVAASFTRSVASGPPTTSVTLSGAGYGANEAVELRFDDGTLQVTSTTSTGNFGPIALTVPGYAAPGLHDITAVGEHTGFSQTQTFNVVTSWSNGGFGPSGRRDNPYENQLTTYNVSDLSVSRLDNADKYGNRTPHLVVGGNVYVGTVVGNVYAYSSTGTLLWHASNGKDLQRWDPVSVAGKVVFAASDGTVLAYPLSCRSDGGLCAASWTQAAGANGNLNAANGIIYVPSSSGGIHRLLPATGASAGPDVNPFAATAPVTTSMSVGADGTEFWGSGSTYTWTSTTGFSSTSGPAGGTVSDAAIANNDIYFTSSDGQLHKFGPSGWAAAVTGSGCSIAPAVMQGVAYAAGCTSIGAYDERTGALIWSVPEGNVSGISTANGVVYACAAPPGASGSELVAYDAGYGGKLWSGGSCNDTPEVVNGKLYAGVGAVEVYDTAPTPARQHGGRQR